ncbi:hypothetical protein [Bradyrhizobium cytisi]|uniref:Uncharacterized protein n=1 Tax=Bradyrhizobium cytisi TaxID=515489 RepID=A0A5S4X0A9_9BRAD|nr:hypothetical protein [Bradyrhizobium cytisi]TYL85810.1 hypothetical protein FXB38_09715 [Bradyrhizobium cytisi]
MLNRDDAWIVTDERLPCVAIEADLKTALGLEEIKDALRGSFKSVSNVYNCAAYEIDEEFKIILCIRASKRIAFVFFSFGSTKGNLGGVGFEPLWSRILDLKGKIERVLSRQSLARIEVGVPKLQLSKKGPDWQY